MSVWEGLNKLNILFLIIFIMNNNGNSLFWKLKKKSVCINITKNWHTLNLQINFKHVHKLEFLVYRQ